MTAKPAKVATPPLAQLADELGLLEKEYALLIAPFEKKFGRVKALKETLQAACTAKATDEWIVEGARFGVRLGPCAMQRSINFKSLVRRIGAMAFAKFAECTLTRLELCVERDVIDDVVTAAQTGPRKLTTFEKGVLENSRAA